MSLLTTKNGRVMLADAVYSVGKKVVQLVLPAAATLYFALAQIWDLPAPTKVIGSIAAVATFLGVTLHISSTQFDASGAAYDGTVHVTNTPVGSNVNFHIDPNDLVTKDSITFKVVQPPVPPVASTVKVEPKATPTTPLPPSSGTAPPASS